ncbi:patatin-like phospholipase family protein [Ideonella oryzae]|uniref:Patatin-like phospholipase family protein n=1 Tax=Ideonella oryzae TaxID=2937441 RepID=A0ABT1BL16_9BURK|nr:patatin-like phospholipase family protein [Ideonella oryzae]MCO5976905.1 patatin-like phospholipase family protein [Ideonella oryzae]
MPRLLTTALLLGSLHAAAWSAAALTPPLPPATAASAASTPAAGQRPRVGLVLSGGGARGISHVGVLKVLEAQHIPIDVIAGTSMGAIIGGLYASGMKADQIEAAFKKINWTSLFSTRVGREELSQRRKEQDFELSTAVELGWRDGEFRAPQGAVSSRGLDALLRRYTLPAQEISDFNRLPIPFRAVATDMETGRPVILDRGDLATALRSSMSVPGVFPATEVNGRILGDGGLVDNVPVDVARAMGADIVIVVNIGTPLAGRETLNSAIGLTAQMINILTEQNVRHSLDSLGPRDILIQPELGTLTSGDFDKVAQLIDIGEAGARASTDRLTALATPNVQYADWQLATQSPSLPPTQLDFVAFGGTTATNPGRLQPQLESKAGEPFDPAKAERDARYLAASGDYVQADYHLVHDERGDGLLFTLEDKPWGPTYLNAGLDLSTDFSGNSAFNIKLSLNRHWLTPNGTEWRSIAQIGEVPRLFTELYHPLNWNIGLSDDWFVSGWTDGERRKLSVFNSNGGDKIGELRRSQLRIGLDLGQPWGNLGEVRVGPVYEATRSDPLLAGGADTLINTQETWQEMGLRGRVVVDQLDYANFPQRGYRFETDALVGTRHERGDSHNLAWVESQVTGAASWGRQTITLHGEMKAANTASASTVGRYSLGGFQQLSGYQPGQVSGNALVFGRLNWYMRLAETPVFARGFFVGTSVEAGNAWQDYRDLRLTGLRYGGSVFLGADTGLGPMYLGLTWAPRGEAGLALVIGRP